MNIVNIIVLSLSRFITKANLVGVVPLAPEINSS